MATTFNFKGIAKEATESSFVMKNREKVDLDDIIKDNPDGVTIIEADLMNGTDKNGNPEVYPVLAIKEDKKVFFFGGCVVKQIVQKWLESFNGDAQSMSAELTKSGGVKIKFTKGRTKSGNNITKCEIID